GERGPPAGAAIAVEADAGQRPAHERAVPAATEAGQEAGAGCGAEQQGVGGDESHSVCLFNRHAARILRRKMAFGRPDRENRARTAGRSCAHCASPIPEGTTSELYCCAGCEGVAALLRAEALTRYYELAGGAIAPVGAPPV